MTDDNQLYDLSRRKVLGGLATIGAAGAGAGLGTSALFSDEEEFEDNTFTAGTLDMTVTGEIVATNSGYADEVADVTGNPITADGNAVEGAIQLQDVKPGDWFIVEMTVDAKPNSNPFYVTLHGDTLEEREGAATDPENDVDNNTTDDGNWDVIQSDHSGTNAELGEKLLITYWEGWDEGEGTRASLTNLDNITNAATNDFYYGTRGNLADGGDPDEDGVVQSSGPAVEYTNAREFYYGDPTTTTSNDPLGNGFASGDGILVGGVSNPVDVGGSTYNNTTGGSGQDPVERRLSDPDNDGMSELRFYLCLEIPEEVGNEIQGDMLRGNFRVNAEQVRNNPDPRSGDT